MANQCWLQRHRTMRYRQQQSFGLVAVVLLLALITVLVTTLLFVVTNDRVANSDYAEQVRAQELAVAGIQTMIADLRQEMQAGSAVITPANGGSIWFPNSGATMRIAAISNAPSAANHLRASLPFTPSAIFLSPNYSGTPPFSRASNSSTTNYSQNNRTVPYPAFWDKAYLYQTNLATSSKPPAPSWIYVQRSGVTTNGLVWSPTLLDKTQGNASFVLGRFAFQLYDTGGLLDANVAGAPTTSSPADVRAMEGTLAGVDLTQVGLTSQNIADLIAFRDSATQSAYVASITNTTINTNGFMITSSGNNRFLSRGDLIRFAGQSGFTGALPYLTHFSRDLNVPSWRPAYDPTAPYTYRTSATGTQATNRFLSTVTSVGETQTNYTISGVSQNTSLGAGQPRLWKRFPLARIDWLTQVKAGSTGLTDAVLANFGLNWDSTNTKWVYNPSSGLTPASTILTLDAIPAGRAPNFFELLKAGILTGSLGVNSGTTHNNMLLTYNYALDNYTSTSAVLLQDPNLDYHIIKIGASIIDQYTSTPWPTTIDFDYAPSMSTAWKQGFRVPASGIKNLPYIYTISQCSALVPGAGGTTATELAWLEFELWNLHQQGAGSTPITIQMTSGNAANSSKIIGSWDYFTSSGDNGLNFTQPGLQATGNRYIQVASTSLANYLTPKTLLASDVSSTSETSGVFTASTGTRQGFYLGAATFTLPAHYNQYYFSFGATSDSGVATSGLPLQLQVQPSAGSAWVPYQGVNLESVVGMRMSIPVLLSSPMSSASTNESWGYVPSDPRTTRGGWAYTSAEKSMTPSLYGDGIFAGTGSPGVSADGVTRPNDIGTVAPNATGSTNERPVFLGRQFHTPGDMGYAFRDQPWKSVDFRSTNSADSGLLDIFSVYDDPQVTAGHINLNSVPQPVVKSIVAGSTKNEVSGSSFTASDADSIASAFTNWVATAPMLSRAELASFASTNAITGVITNNRKFEREGAIRALSGVGQTRTINLLLDIVAQAGFFGKNATSLDNFYVTAQVHYWAHIAIDRYTGQVVDLQLEPVYE